MASAVVVAALGACGHGAQPTPSPAQPHVARADAAVADAAPPKPLVDDLPRLAKLSVELYDELQQTLVAAGTDCDAAATSLNALADRYAEALAANSKVLHAGRDKVVQLRAALVPYQERMDASMRGIIAAPVMRACSQHAGFASAFDRIGGEVQ
jgi:ABC-type transporter Mla subunit MlaD